MEILNLKQGSEEWKKVRLEYFTASEAPVVMGCSPYMTRDELLELKKTGVEKEITTHQQKIFDQGHKTESMARTILEHEMGEDFYPVTGTDGGNLLASFDGVTMDHQVIFEHKLWNKEKADQIINSGEPEPMYYWQLEQQLLVSGANHAVFVISDGTKENWVEVKYFSKTERRDELIAAWKQFAKDLENYEPKIYKEAPAAQAIMELPDINYTLNGLALSSNIDIFKAAAEKLFEDSKKKIETDQDFADTESLVKKFKEAERKIKLVQGQAVGEIEDVDKFCRDLAYIAEMIRKARLAGENAVKNRKTEIRIEIKNKINDEYRQYVNSISKFDNNIELNMPEINVIDAMKGKKTIKSLNEAANDELARAKIEAGKRATLINENLSYYNKEAKGKEFLFNDLNVLASKDREFFVLTVDKRIADHDERERVAAERAKAREAAAVEAAEAKAREAAADAVSEGKPAKDNSAIEAHDLYVVVGRDNSLIVLGGTKLAGSLQEARDAMVKMKHIDKNLRLAKLTFI